MDYRNFILYLFSILCYLISVKRKQIGPQNAFVYVFLGFQILYPSSIVIVSLSGLANTFPSSLHVFFYNPKILNGVLLTSSIALLTFAFCIYRFPVIQDTNSYEITEKIGVYKRLLGLFLPVAIYLNAISDWTTERVGLIPSLAAYSRNIMTVIIIVLFVSRKISFKMKLVFLATYFVITFLSTQRTNAFIIIIAFIYNLKSNKWAFRYSLVGISLLLVLGSIRNGVSAVNILYPIFGEGIFGGWGLLQAIDVIEYDGYSFSQFFFLLNSFWNWLLGFFQIEWTLPTYENIISSGGYDYYPMGGFFYLSDAYLMHPIIGPILYTLLIYWFYHRNLNAFYRKHDPLNLICLAILFDAVKGSLATFFTMLIFHVLFYKLIVVITKIK